MFIFLLLVCVHAVILNCCVFLVIIQSYNGYLCQRIDSFISTL